VLFKLRGDISKRTISEIVKIELYIYHGFMCKNGRGIEWRGQIEPKRSISFVKINLKLINGAKRTI